MLCKEKGLMFAKIISSYRKKIWNPFAKLWQKPDLSDQTNNPAKGRNGIFLSEWQNTDPVACKPKMEWIT